MAVRGNHHQNKLRAMVEELLSETWRRPLDRIISLIRVRRLSTYRELVRKTKSCGTGTKRPGQEEILSLPHTCYVNFAIFLTMGLSPNLRPEIVFAWATIESSIIAASILNFPHISRRKVINKLKCESELTIETRSASAAEPKEIQLPQQYIRFPRF